jgi:hypothetical protein
MRSDELDVLAQDSVKLFLNGACHVFAMELARKINQERQVCELIRTDVSFLAGNIPAPQKNRTSLPGFHVAVRKDRNIIDINGVHGFDDYEIWVKGVLSGKCKSINPDSIRIKYAIVTSNDLITKTQHSSEGSDWNAWQHLVGREFLKEARMRAAMMVNSLAL